MYSPVSNNLLKNDTSFITGKEITFLAIMTIVSGVLFYCMSASSSMLMVAVAIPLCLYDRSYVFPMLLTIALCQGAFEAAEVTQSSATQSTDFSETLIIAAVSPMLLWDLTHDKISRITPARFVIFYVVFLYFVIQGVIIYYQYPGNYAMLILIHAKWSPVLHSIMKSIKIVFYIFYLRVLINNTVEKNLKTLETTRRFIPFILIIMALNLLLNGRAQSGAGYQDTLQLGDAHHGSFTAQLCGLSIYCFITFFMQKVSLATRGFALLGIAAVGVCIMEMGSRNGLVSFALVALIGFYVNMRRKSWSYIVLWSLAAFLATVVTAVISYNSPTIQRAIYMTEQQGGGDRVYYWQAGAQALQEHPLFGRGGDESASQAVVAEYAPAGTEDKVMHNTYLEMAVEYGLIGLIFYLCLLFAALKWGYRLYKLAIETGNLLIAAPPINYMVLMVAACFVSDVWDTSIWYNLSMIFALAIQLVYYQYIDKKKVDRKISLGEALALSR
ncbi:MAG: O-antigen ligase family protein [Parafilimonas sp.]